jgi:hypothetical protein
MNMIAEDFAKTGDDAWCFFEDASEYMCVAWCA